MNKASSWISQIVLFIIIFSFSVTKTDADPHGSSSTPMNIRPYSLYTVSQAEAVAWREDLQFLAHELRRLHPDPFHKISETDFIIELKKLEDSIEKHTAQQIILGFARLLALVGEGHTSLALYAARGVNFHVAPYRLGIYGDGIYVEAADSNYASLVGGRLISISGVSAEEALARVVPLISRDNNNWIKAVAPNLLNRIEVLQSLGLARNLDHVVLSVELAGQVITEKVKVLPNLAETSFGLPFMPKYTDNWVDARDQSQTPAPQFQRDFEKLYWWEYSELQDLLYIKFDQVQNRFHGPTALEIFRQAMTFARQKRPAKTVIDIRNNTGGSGTLLPALVRQIVQTREIDEKGKLFVIIGRRTFSAGQMFTASLETYSSAIFVGEPTSAFYNGYAGHEAVQLPNSRIVFMVAPNYYQLTVVPTDRRKQATPMLAAIPEFEDYTANRDPALQVVLSYQPDTFNHDLIKAINDDNLELFVNIVNAYDLESINQYRKSSERINALGYHLLSDGSINQAIKVFKLNLSINPDYVNGWDSLGEAYVSNKQTIEAIVAFKQAVKLDPHHRSAGKWLARLELEEAN